MCTDLLMDEIQDGEVWFDSEVWDRVSHLAKDLIMAMLTDVTERFTTEDVLDHPYASFLFIFGGGYLPGVFR